MRNPRPAAALLATIAAAALLAGCGSDGADGPAGVDRTDAGAKVGAKAGGGSVDGPCDVTDRTTVASVFPGAAAGKAGSVRNCEFAVASGSVTKVNVFYFDGTTLAQYKQQCKDNDIAFTAVPIGDGAIRDQVHTVVVQQGAVLFGVQAIGHSMQAAALARNDPQVMALARAIAAGL
ncbi:hypothetical protein SAMN05443575_2461 [Jatrophihabitans endophyticus]|uniref:DUF3558 domain-containing protein n=1 Tax=Jatrophihabitans endophyticus TaxID=1206085 RepID=A0A1M5LKE1_9ACTN|nr:hypothetical protein [Jatrophihabitans endophyticus]SHG64833.1 hypothetical protein SAMN05443575_2461 [Jatrophihabitans endophyticus]